MVFTVARELVTQKRRIRGRLAKARRRQDSGRTDLPRSGASSEGVERIQDTGHGGLGAVRALVVATGLPGRLDLLQAHRPYHESDPVPAIAYHAMCGGRLLEDMERRRTDEALLRGLGVEALPEPTTAGHFCRPFSACHLQALMEAVNETRLPIRRRQGADFWECAVIDANVPIVQTMGKCKEGMALSSKGAWGYHPSPRVISPMVALRTQSRACADCWGMPRGSVARRPQGAGSAWAAGCSVAKTVFRSAGVIRHSGGLPSIAGEG